MPPLPTISGTLETYFETKLKYSGQERFNIFQRVQIKADNLLPTTESENQVKGGFLLDVIITQGTTILKLFASKD